MEEQSLLNAVKCLNEEAWLLRNSALIKALSLMIPDATFVRKSAEHLRMSATSLLTKSWIHYRLADVGLAVSLAEQVLACFEELQDEINVARALNFLGNFFIIQSKNEKAVSCFERSLATYQSLQGVGYIIESTEGFELVGKYESLELALALMPEPDVILMDIHLPGKSGIEGRQARRTERQTQPSYRRRK